MPENVSVVEGEQLEIICKVQGHEPRITWSVGKWLIFAQKYDQMLNIIFLLTQVM